MPEPFLFTLTDKIMDFNVEKSNSKADITL